MSKIELREDLIASRYQDLPGPPGFLFTFESQEGLPVDAGNPLLRTLSPFTLRLVVPELPESGSATNVDLMGNALQSISDAESDAKAVRDLFGISKVTGSDPRATLQRIVSAGQVMTGATSTERAVLVDASTAADIAYQIENILATPPLTLLVNPREMQLTYGTVQQFTNRTRYGRIFERWGESQPTVSFSGSTGAFITCANPQRATGSSSGETSSTSGVQFASKRDSAAYQNLVSLIQYYKSNGYIYDTIKGSDAHLMIGAVAIDYDQWTYVGHIESFDYSYTAELIHRLEWSMEFTIDRMYDRAESPVSVLPMQVPGSVTVMPASAGTSYPDALLGGFVGVSGTQQFSEAPLDAFLPSQIRTGR